MKTPPEIVLLAEMAECDEMDWLMGWMTIDKRVCNPGIGNGKLLDHVDVVNQKGAFSCLKKPNKYTKAWKDLCDGYPLLSTPDVFNKKELEILEKIKQIRKEANLWRNRLNWQGVYFADLSITDPDFFDNKYYDSYVIHTSRWFRYWAIKPR